LIVRFHLSRRTRGARVRAGRAHLFSLVVVSCGLVITGCGSSTSSSSRTSSTSTAAAAQSTGTHSAAPAPTPVGLQAAEHPSVAQFPSAHGRSLEQLGKTAKSAVTLGAATGSYTPGQRRFAFALTQHSGEFLYEPTAIYIASSPTARAQGPFLAPADPMGVAPRYRSKQNTGPGGIQAIYAAHVPLPRSGTFAVLSLTLTPHGYVGAPGEIAVARSSPIPDVGRRPPAISTDTAASVHGDTSLLTTRLPPEQMASVSFDRVLGKRPVALLFSTPQLCTSRVCGPVTDVAVSLQHQFANRITFIHQEVYVGNQPSKGLRPQLKAFHLQTEPWLFVVNRRGTIVARLEGAFGSNEMTAALQAALK
jgi:hypothetical protein